METNNIFNNITRNCLKESLSEEECEDLIYFDNLLAMASVGERTMDISLIQPLAAQVQITKKEKQMESAKCMNNAFEQMADKQFQNASILIQEVMATLIEQNNRIVDGIEWFSENQLQLLTLPEEEMKRIKTDFKEATLLLRQSVDVLNSLETSDYLGYLSGRYK